MAVTLRDFMSGDDVLTIEPEATLGAAARKMRHRNVGAAVVVDENNAVTGIFTERDLLRAIADSRHPDVGQVQSYMTPDPITLPSDHLPSEAARIMADGKFRHIPVVDDGKLVGVVSIRDLMQAGLHIQTADAHIGSDFP
jgi:CBS domain-containing protein